MAKSSSSVPMGVSSGSSTTWYVPVSGMAPPEVMAISREPRRGVSRRPTASRWMRAPTRPRRVATPSASMSTTASKSSLRRSAYWAARRQRANSASSSCSPPAQMATICCASTSSGAFRSVSVSISPRRAARTSAAVSTS
jgi:hypothetical protein